MTLLDEIIAGSTDDSVSTANLLRKVQIAASHLGAGSITAWAKGELSGYDPTQPGALPDYRSDITPPVRGHFEGPFGTSARGVLLSSAGTSDSFTNTWFKIDLFQPVSELERLANTTGESEPEFAWSPEAAGLYRKWGAEGRVMRMEMMQLFSAAIVIPRTLLYGIVEKVRNRALDFALEMQAASPDAGSQNGPTVGDPDISSAVANTTINIYGHGTNVATGTNIRQKTKVTVGDASALRGSAQGYGLEEAAASEFVAIVNEEQGTAGPRFTAFVSKVRNGAISLSGNVAANVAASGLIEIANQYLGQS